MKKKVEKPRSYQRYDKSFKLEAINLMNQGRSVKELSESLGVKEGVLYRWKSEGRREQSKPSEEVKALKKKNKRLEEEVEILKKALSIFSQSG